MFYANLQCDFTLRELSGNASNANIKSAAIARGDAALLCNALRRRYGVVGGLVGSRHAQWSNAPAAAIAIDELNGRTQCLAEVPGLYVRIAYVHNVHFERDRIGDRVVHAQIVSQKSQLAPVGTIHFDAVEAVANEIVFQLSICRANGCIEYGDKKE